MPKLNWDANDFQDSQSSSGTTSDNISHGGNLQQGYKHGSLTEGLVAYYPMEKGEGEILHDGAFNNLGQINGATWNESMNKGNYSLDFDGTSDNVELSDSISSSTFTLSCWLYRDTTGSNFETLIVSGDPDNKQENFLFDIVDDKLRLGFNDVDGNFTSASSGSTLNKETLYRVTAVFDGDRIKLFIDANKEKEVNESSPPFQNPTKTRISERYSDRNYDGKLADMRIYNRALSHPEIMALANTGTPSGILKKEKDVPGQSEGGVSRYKLDGNADDAWGDNNGTNNGADLTATGVYGQAANFNGSENVSFSNSPIPATDKITISFWTKGASTQPKEDFIMHAQDLSGDRVLTIHVPWDDGKVYWDFGDSPEERMSVDLTGFDWQTWNHWVFTVDSTKPYMAIYRNGELIKKDKTVGKELTSKPDKTKIGSKSNDNRYYEGKIDDVRIYDKALTPLQVEKLYNKGAYRIPRESTLQ